GLVDKLQSDHVTLGSAEEQIIGEFNATGGELLRLAIVPGTEANTAIEYRIIHQQDLSGFLGEGLNLWASKFAFVAPVAGSLDLGQSSCQENSDRPLTPAAILLDANAAARAFLRRSA